MKNTWFNYNRKISSDKLYKKLTAEEKNCINKFKDYLLISACQSRTDEGVREVLRFKEITGKLIEANLEDLRYFLKALKESFFADHTKNKIKSFIQRFLKWNFKDWSERFNEFYDIKLNGDAQNKKIINSKTLPTNKEIELLLEAEPSLYWKTFLITQSEGALRTGETRELTWDMITFEDDGFTTLNIPSKKNRNGTIKVNPVVVKIAGRFLKKLKEQQEEYGIKTKWVFPSPQNPNKHISKSVNTWFNKLSKKVLGHSVNNYSLRHAKGTDLQRKVREGTLSKDNAVGFMRHSEKMFDRVYSHMDSSDIKQLMKKQIYNTKELTAKEKNEIEELRYKILEDEKAIKMIQDVIENLKPKDLPFLKDFVKF